MIEIQYITHVIEAIISIYVSFLAVKTLGSKDEYGFCERGKFALKIVCYLIIAGGLTLLTVIMKWARDNTVNDVFLWDDLAAFVIFTITLIIALILDNELSRIKNSL